MTLWTDKTDGKERAKYGDEVTRHRNLLVGLIKEAVGANVALDQPVAVRISARFARPSSHFLPANGKRPAPELRDNAPDWWTGFPDADKIARLVNDALTIGGAIRDDSLVVVCRVEKVYAQTNETAVELWTLD